MNTQERELVAFLTLLEEVGCLSHVVLIGSWAELLYERTGLLQGFQPNIKTMDIDFLVRNLRRSSPAVELTMEARRQGYLVESDRITGVTKIMSTRGLEVEFLISKAGAGLESALRTNLGVTAQSLRHLDTLSLFMMTIEYQGMAVNIPMPEAYAVHKMVVNAERGRKQAKDAFAIENMWPYLNPERLETVLSSLTKKERGRALSFMEEHGLSYSME